MATVVVESPKGSSDMLPGSTDPGGFNCAAMSAGDAQIRINPHATKTARQVLELPALHMGLSGYFAPTKSCGHRQGTKKVRRTSSIGIDANATIRSSND
jgi:hypothetical protein